MHLKEILNELMTALIILLLILLFIQMQNQNSGFLLLVQVLSWCHTAIVRCL